jgi:hypothetical protein
VVPPVEIVILWRVAASGNFGDLYQIDPDLSIVKCVLRNWAATEMRFEGAKCRDQDA